MIVPQLAARICGVPYSTRPLRRVGHLTEQLP